MTKIDKQKQGRRSRAAGTRFEIKVRKELEKDSIVDKWTNNIDLEEGKLVKAKPKFIYNPQLKRRIPIGISSGFPDFVTFQRDNTFNRYLVTGVESKMDGILDKEERAKCKWLLKNEIFNKILVASKSKQRGKIDFKEFDLK